MAFSMDSGLRRNDPVKENRRGDRDMPLEPRSRARPAKNPKNRVGKAERFG
jgi:hypothetical protein